MKDFRLNISLLIIFYFTASLASNAQGSGGARVVFRDLQAAFNKNDVSVVSVHLADETYISLLNGYSDYYSKSQAFYVLKEFVSFFSPMRMKLTHVSVNTSSPYAWGTLYYSERGKNKSAKVFVSVSKVKGKFVISQLTIN
jgi:hypothetical protein